MLGEESVRVLKGLCGEVIPVGLESCCGVPERTGEWDSHVPLHGVVNAAVGSWPGDTMCGVCHPQSQPGTWEPGGQPSPPKGFVNVILRGFTPKRTWLPSTEY